LGSKNANFRVKISRQNFCVENSYIFFFPFSHRNFDEKFLP
jgi:hypothetical protein